MDLSDLTLRARVGAAKPAGPAVQPLDTQMLVAQLGGEVAATLSSALERVTALATTGRIDKASLRALREEIDLARRAGIMGQQVVRLGNGRVQLARERLDLTALLREAMRLRAREIDARGIEVRQLLSPADVVGDATLHFSLLETALGWSFQHAVGRIELRLEVSGWPAHARLSSSFAHRPPDEVQPPAVPGQTRSEAALDTMSWRLLQQTAVVLGLPLTRRDTPGRTELVLEFPDTQAARVDAGAAIGADDGAAPVSSSQPLVGRHLIVLAARREVRNVVREALRPMGLMIDFVSSVDEAQQLSAEGLPHAIVYEASLGGERFDRFRDELLAQVPNLAFVQIAEQGRAFDVLNAGGRQFASVGRDALIESLAAALLFELSRQG
jgi:hypothetical protein